MCEGVLQRLESGRPGRSAALCAILLGFVSSAAFGQGSPPIIWQQQVNSDRINCMTFSHDGSELITGSSDRLINLWRASDGTLIKVLDSNAPDVHPSSIESLSINSADNIIATVNYQELKLWHLPAGTETVITADSDWDVWCDFSPSGAYVATASFDNKIKIWRVSDGTLTRTFDTGSQQRAVAWSPNGRWLAYAGGDNQVTVRDTSTWAIAAHLTGPTSDIYVLRFSPDSSMIASGGYDQTARIWSTSGWSPLYTFDNNGGNVYGLAFSPDSSVFAYTDGEGNTIRLVHTSDGSIYRTYTDNTDNVQCMSFAPNGTFAYGRADHTVVVANVLSDSGGGGTGGGTATVQLTSPADGSGYNSPADVKVSATAKASKGVAQVAFYANGSLIGTASSAPFSIDWSGVGDGNYTIQAVLTDKAGTVINSGTANISVTTYVPPANTLTLNINGNGHISPNLNGRVLPDGKKYVITALPSAGNLFAGWSDGSGNTIASTARLTFTMQDNLILQANFVPNPFVQLKGHYSGAVQSDPATTEGAGRIGLDLLANGVFTANLFYGGPRYLLSGRFQADGIFSRTIPRRGKAPLTVNLQLDVSGNSGQITGTVSDGNVTSSVTASLVKWTVRNNPAPAGYYTALFQPDTSQPDSPQGYGYAIVTISKAGVVVASGHLADGSAFTMATYLSSDMTWPFYFTLPGGAETAAGVISLRDTGTSDMDGSITWSRSAIRGALRYANGFNAQVSFIGSTFVAPRAGNPALNLASGEDNASVTLGGSDLSSPVTFVGTVAGNDRFKADPSSNPPRAFALTLGQFGGMSGSFIDPTSGAVAPFVGVSFQKQNFAAGYFFSSRQSGFIQLTPNK